MPKFYSTDEIKFKTSEEDKFKIIEKLKMQISNGLLNLPKIIDIIDIDGVRVRFEDGWALVRASNTTPVIVTRFEAKTPKFRDFLQDEFLKILNEIAGK